MMSSNAGARYLEAPQIQLWGPEGGGVW